MNIASIDIGSNSVILLIAEVIASHRRYVTVLNKYATPRIGKNLTRGKDFDPESVIRLIEVLKDFLSIAKANNAEIILPAATQAFRNAKNAKFIVEKIKNELGIEIKILTGYEEGLLTYYGASSIKEYFSGYIIDIGGGSTEVFLGSPGELNFSHSFNFGAVNICEEFGTVPPIGEEKLALVEKFVRESIRKEAPLPLKNLPAIAVAGTPTSLACIQLGITKFDETKIEGFELLLEDIMRISSDMSMKSPGEILSSYGEVVLGREDVILTGAIILKTIMKILNYKSIFVSTHGLRHGIIYNYLNKLL